MLIEQYLDPLDFANLEFQRFRTRAVIFYLMSTCELISSVGWGNLRMPDLVLQMEGGDGIVSMALAETILSLDRAYRVDKAWSASLILLQVWLRDHLSVVEPPRRCPYVSQYKSRRVLVRGSEDEWLQWLLVLRPGQILWRCDWYEIRRFLVWSARFQMAYLLSMDHITFYLGSKLMRQLRHTQGLPPVRALFHDTLISPRVTVVVLGSWFRGAHIVEAGVFGGKTATYEAWWIAKHGDRE
ncbi:hypothetical protein JCGZ_05970 [Jatropha curcas]|uniref:Aminotransferase-like plant mobile domain-containing protein n=1 Tax=Jatropha curcas TaxID=180498 RepID=A0A067KMR2_JATCU|nr:hypothetical protein JCGZ_05970 [Jatropha curcas]